MLYIDLCDSIGDKYRFGVNGNKDSSFLNDY